MYHEDKGDFEERACPGEAQFDLVPGGPGPDGRGLVRWQFVQDDVDQGAVRARAARIDWTADRA
jgi:hypothetical protein